MNEDMEMPTLCDCGQWFDLNDGYANHDRKKTICEDCAELNEKRKELLGEIRGRERVIEDLEDEIECLKSWIIKDEENLKDLPEFK